MQLWRQPGDQRLGERLCETLEGRRPRSEALLVRSEIIGLDSPTGGDDFVQRSDLIDQADRLGLFAGPNLAVAASFGSFAVTWTAVVTGLVGVIAGVASWRGRERSAAANRVGIAGLGLAAIAIVVGLVASLGFSNAKLAAGDIALRAKDTKFVPLTLVVPHGQVSFFLDNADNTLHNLHILGVTDGTKTMPANHKTHFTVALAAGAYKYRCDYHSDMKGTLTVT